MVRDADVVDGAVAVGFTLGTPGVGQIGLVEDVLVDRGFARLRHTHAAELGIYDVLWQQHIFTQERASEGWRAMADRGSATANHYDHVHASVY